MNRPKKKKVRFVEESEATNRATAAVGPEPAPAPVPEPEPAPEVAAPLEAPPLEASADASPPQTQAAKRGRPPLSRLQREKKKVEAAKKVWLEAERACGPWYDAAFQKLLENHGCTDELDPHLLKFPPRSLLARLEQQRHKRWKKIRDLKSAWLDAAVKYDEDYKHDLECTCKRLRKENSDLRADVTLLQRQRARLQEQNESLLRTRHEEDAACEREELDGEIEWAERWLRGERPEVMQSRVESGDEEWDEARGEAEMIAASRVRCQGEQELALRAMSRR